MVSVTICAFCVSFFFVCVKVTDYLFFFSSRRRHTRSLCDWSSDVCSSDLCRRSRISPAVCCKAWGRRSNGRSEERRVGKSVDLGGRRIIKKKKKNNDKGNDTDLTNTGNQRQKRQINNKT